MPDWSPRWSSSSSRFVRFLPVEVLREGAASTAPSLVLAALRERPQRRAAACAVITRSPSASGAPIALAPSRAPAPAGACRHSTARTAYVTATRALRSVDVAAPRRTSPDEERLEALTDREPLDAGASAYAGCGGRRVSSKSWRIGRRAADTASERPLRPARSRRSRGARSCRRRDARCRTATRARARPPSHPSSARACLLHLAQHAAGGEHVQACADRERAIGAAVQLREHRVRDRAQHRVRRRRGSARTPAHSAEKRWRPRKCEPLRRDLVGDRKASWRAAGPRPRDRPAAAATASGSRRRRAAVPTTSRSAARRSVRVARQYRADVPYRAFV